MAMASARIPWWISAVWLSMIVVAALLFDASLRGWLLATTIGVVPVGVLLRLWNDAPQPTIADVLHPTDGRR